jgi:uncharacterized protein
MGSLSAIQGSRSPSRASRILRATAVVLTVVALLMGIVAALTFRVANEVMRREPKPIESFPANLMPPYAIVGFPSLDGVALSGWFFPSRGTPRGTVVLVHSDAENRLQFGEATASLYKSLVAQRFNVLSFDLRHCGDSDGRLTTYGYNEWEDVLAAVDYARRTTTTTGVVLYGFGSGAGAALAAWSELPATEADRASKAPSVSSLPLTREYILALVLDGPENTTDDAIRKAMLRLGLLSVFPLPQTVPIAVRLSAGVSDDYPLSALASRYQRPMLVLEALPAGGGTSRLLAERLRLHPETTSVLQGVVPSGTSLFETDATEYLKALTDFLDRYLP